MKMPTVLPENILKCLSPLERKRLGKAGMTKAEAADRAEAKNERELQRQIVSYLQLKGIEVLWHRTDKRSTATIGWPDVTFTIGQYVSLVGIFPVACAWEIKFSNGKLSKEQSDLATRLQSPPNFWRFRVITSFEQARRELRELGIC